MKIYRIIGLVFLVMFVPIVLSGEIAITFDDAPRADSAIMSGVKRTELIIKGLVESEVSDVLFFVTTGNIGDEGEARLKRYVEAGHHLGNHSHNHISANKTSVNGFMEDIYQAYLILKDYNGTVPFFRFPYLHYGETNSSIQSIQKYLVELNYRNGYITVNNFDWYINSLLNKAKNERKIIDYEKFGDLYVDVLWEAIEFYDGIAIKSLGRSPKHILLLHENDTSALFISKLVRHIKAKGWKVISPEEAYTDAIAESLPNVLFHNQGRVAALANSLGATIESLQNVAENKEYLDALFEESNVFTPKK